jgi:2',3'-cyclic-nucleotide 2'-phosphodiesterase (5'-nucleotidase family)
MLTYFLAYVLASSVSSGFAAPLSIIYTNNLEGYVNTCGCAVNPGGGVKRRLNWFKKTNPSPDTTLYLDSGDTLSSVDSFMDYEKDKANMAADIILKHFKLMNIDAFTPGEKDLALDLETLVKTYKTPLLISNSGKKGLNKAIKIVRAGYKIGILGVLSPELAKSKSLKLGPIIPSLKKILPELKKSSDIIILLAHCGEDELKKISKEIKGIDIILSAHIQEQLTEPGKVNNTLILRMLNGGDSIGMLDFNKNKKGRIEYKNNVFFLGSEYNQDNELIANDIQKYEKLQVENPAASDKDINDNF